MATLPVHVNPNVEGLLLEEAKSMRSRPELLAAVILETIVSNSDFLRFILCSHGADLFEEPPHITEPIPAETLSESIGEFDPSRWDLFSVQAVPSLRIQAGTLSRTLSTEDFFPYDIGGIPDEDMYSS
ncbi:MAG: hypothetical protein P4L46_21015 [Fimbriimonas sp.]|nr:hypothetical protein [Fimbriimonas sp.]